MIKRGNWHDNKVPIDFVTVQYNFLLCVHSFFVGLYEDESNYSRTNS